MFALVCCAAAGEKAATAEASTASALWPSVTHNIWGEGHGAGRAEGDAQSPAFEVMLAVAPEKMGKANPVPAPIDVLVPIRAGGHGDAQGEGESRCKG